MDRLSLAARGDETLRAQSREMLGEGRLAEPDCAFQLGDGALAIEQLAQNHQAVLVAERAEKVRGLPRIPLQCLYIHTC